MQNSVDIDDYSNNGEFTLSQNNPNPFNGTTDVLLSVADAGTVTLEITDVNGRIVGTHRVRPQSGTHQFRITLSAAGTYVMTARQNGKTSSIKMMNNGGGNGDGIEYAGIVETMCTSSLQPKSHTRGTTNNPFNFGDMMEYVGYATINGETCESQRITQAQGTSQTHFLQFNEIQNGFPCPNAATLTDIDGNVYNTVQIGNQCWMKENLRTTRYANSTVIANGETASNETEYWYYPNEDAANKPTYGLLYNWKAVMHDSPSSGSNPSGVQGICPNGWHVPSDEEWKQLEIAVGMSQSEANNTEYRGDIAAKLSGNIGWTSSGTANAAGNLSASERNSSGFSALPAGSYIGSYTRFGTNTYFWSSTENDDLTWTRYMYYNVSGVCRHSYNKRYGLSVRCLKD